MTFDELNKLNLLLEQTKDLDWKFRLMCEITILEALIKDKQQQLYQYSERI